jgi:hypothetical protein
MLVASLGTTTDPAFADGRNISGAKAAFGKAVKLNQRDAGLCTSYALVCMILDDINSAITALHEVPPNQFLKHTQLLLILFIF